MTIVGEDVNFDLYGVHAAAAVLKAFLKELPEPIMTFELYDDTIRIPGEWCLHIQSDLLCILHTCIMFIL